MYKQEEISKHVQVIVRTNGQVITLRNPCQETEMKSFQFDYTYGLNSDDNGYLQPLAHAEQVWKMHLTCLMYTYIVEADICRPGAPFIEKCLERIQLHTVCIWAEGNW